MAGKAFKCSACGAPLPDPDGTPHLTCRFCGTANKVAQPKPQRPVVAHHVVNVDLRGASEVAGNVAKAAGGVAVAAIVAPLLLTVVGALVAFFLVRSSPTPGASGPAIVLPSFGGGGAAGGSGKVIDPDLLRGPAGFAWQDQYVSPLGVDANGDGVEDLAGPFALEEGGELRSYAGVLDGKTFKLLWKAGPYGLRDKLRRTVGAAVANGKLVVLEGGVKIHVHDLATGKELATADTKADSSRYICAPGGGAPIFVGASWGAGQIVDTKTLKIQGAGAPNACRRAAGIGSVRLLDDTGDVRHLRGATNVRPTLPAMEIKESLSEGTSGVATASPRAEKGLSLVGFDPKTKAMRWTRSLAELGVDGDALDLVDVADGRAYLQAPTKVGPTLIAVDAATGATRWSTPSSQSSVFNVTVSAKRIYVVRGDWPNLPVEVFDVATGKKLARLGKGRDD